MIDFGIWKPTGRKTTGPDSDLLELTDPHGALRTAICYHERYHSAEELTTGIGLVLSFLTFPMVNGLVDLVQCQLSNGAFVYDTGPIFPLIDVLRTYRDHQRPMGVRAGLEIAHAVANALQEASENGSIQGIYSSSGLTPWRIVLSPKGEAKIIGYGLAQMQMVELRQGKEDHPRADNFYYCPPERLLRGQEDIFTDLYALALCTYQCMTGKPLYTGTTSRLEAIVRAGEAQSLLIQNPEGLPPAVHELYVQALEFDPAHRVDSLSVFADTIGEILASGQVTGESLVEVAAKEAAGSSSRKKVLESVAIAPVSPSTGHHRREAPTTATADTSPSPEGRWGKVSRSDTSPPPDKPRRAKAKEPPASETQVQGKPRRVKKPESDDLASTKPKREPEAQEGTPKRPRRVRERTEDTPQDNAPKRPKRVRRASQETSDEDVPKRPKRVRRASQETSDDDVPKRPKRVRRDQAHPEDETDAS